MERRFLALLITLFLIGLSIHTVLYNPSASASVKELNVISRTKGYEALKAEFLNGQLKISLKNNHRETITAFAINFGDTTIKEDFAYSDVHFGIEPGDTFQTSYPISISPVGSELPPVYLLTVLLKNGAGDGNSKVSQEIKDERLGEKIQILRTLKVLEKDGLSSGDLKIVKSDIAAALNTSESETLISLSELQPPTVRDRRLSDDLRTGLQVGREKMLRRFEVLEQLSTEYRQKGFVEFKDRLQKLFAKL